jgi:hypothetical protein
MRRTAAIRPAADFGDFSLLVDFTRLFLRQPVGMPLVKERPIGGAFG